MKRKIIAIVVILLIFLFPFRYAFIEEREFKMINEVWVCEHELFYITSFVITLVASLLFFVIYGNGKKQEANN